MMFRPSLAILLATGVFMLPGLAFARLTHRDVEFMNHVAQSMQSEMELARLAHTHATHPRVRRFARWMLVDNTREYQRLRTLAAQKGVQLPVAPTAEQQALAKLFAGMRDPAFSRRYIVHEINDHRRDARLTSRLLRSTRDRQLRAYADYYLTHTRSHLRLAEGVVSGATQ